MASLVITNPSLKTGDVLSFNFSGFMPNDSIHVWVVGGGGTYFTANPYGAGSGSFQIGESPGNYTLAAQDSQGTQATAPFTVIAAPVPTLNCDPNVRSGEVLNYSFSGFQPNVRVHISVSGGSSSTDKTSDTSGNGTGNISINESPGNYTLYASDAYGHTAYVQFVVTGVSWVALQTVTGTIRIPTATWVALQTVTGTVGGVSWAVLQTITGSVTGSAWAVLQTVAINIQVSSWTILSNVATMIAASNWQVLTSVVAMLGTSNWQVISAVSGLVKIPGGEPPPEEGGTSPWVWALVGGVAVLAAASMSKGKPPVTKPKEKEALTNPGKMG